MAVSSVGNSNQGYYQEYATKVDVVREPFLTDEQVETVKEDSNRSEVPDAFKGISSPMDLLASDKFKKNQIPVVNQIVTSRNPEDGEIYRTFFMDDKIYCNNAEGKKAWELAVNGTEQAEKIKDFFKKYTPYGWAKELYSGMDMGMASVKSFWVELLGEKD